MNEMHVCRERYYCTALSKTIDYNIRVRGMEIKKLGMRFTYSQTNSQGRKELQKISNLRGSVQIDYASYCILKIHF